ncbi:MAG: hypothetical protein HYT72_03420 [Candidatus Aenigmarchaeota archaeon]|nr:hypothetical protein [Candidatus Aenigmarchaeota archaeon]
MDFWRTVGSIGIVAALSGFFLNLTASPAMYPVLDAMFAGGFAVAVGSMAFIRK